MIVTLTLTPPSTFSMYTFLLDHRVLMPYSLRTGLWPIWKSILVDAEPEGFAAQRFSLQLWPCTNRHLQVLHENCSIQIPSLQRLSSRAYVDASRNSRMKMLTCSQSMDFLYLWKFVNFQLCITMYFSNFDITIRTRLFEFGEFAFNIVWSNQRAGYDAETFFPPSVD